MTLFKKLAIILVINNTLAVIVLIDMIVFRYPVFTGFLVMWGLFYLINKKYFIKYFIKGVKDEKFWRKNTNSKK